MAEAQMRHLRALMSNVAHDLKAPVACIVAGQYIRSILINPLPTIHFPCDGKPVLFPSPTCSSSFTACCIVACIIVTQTLLIVLFLVPVLIMTYLKGCTIQWAAFAYAICITGVSVAVWLVQAPYTTNLVHNK